MARKKKWVGKAIKRPGRVKRAAAKADVSVAEEARKMAHSGNASERGAGILAERFQKGGDMHARKHHRGKRRSSRR